jgi:hypothetical protein
MGESTPKLRRLADITAAEHLARKHTRAYLELQGEGREQCKVCPTSVWFTAFFDGTGNNYSEDGGKLDVDERRDARRVQYSNVAKLWMAHAEDDRSNSRRARRYIEGVGTPCPNVRDSGGGLDGALGMAAAYKGELRIRWMLNELQKHVNTHMPFVNQINLAVFGFSRGATQARAFVRLLTETLAFQQGSELIWRQPGLHGKQPKVVVYFLGLFDTVSSTGFGGSRAERLAPAATAAGGTLLLPGVGTVIGHVAGGLLHGLDEGGHAEWARDLRIPSYVLQCVHYVAGHEVREKFPSDSVREDQSMPTNSLEVFYPGMHSDVGGGYAPLCQEGRTNELARVPLNNMFIEAWKAGVPFRSISEIVADVGPLFEISSELEHSWNVYMGQGDVKGIDGPPTSSRLEDHVIWHMNRYYQWRASRRRRLRDGRLQPLGGVDPYMKVTDSEWDKDLREVAQARSGWIRCSVHEHQQAMFDAFEGRWIAALSKDARDAFDRFFDKYVHDSIAGFKQQMKEASAALYYTEMSRWSRNRQYFVGKRETRFLYWRYEGYLPVHAPMQTALMEASQQPTEHDVHA